MVPVSTAWLRASFGWLFPFLLGRAFIEAGNQQSPPCPTSKFPFLLGRAFIEAPVPFMLYRISQNFPSFWEGLSLRLGGDVGEVVGDGISLPFGKGFH